MLEQSRLKNDRAAQWEVTELSDCCKEYEKAILDVCHNGKAIVRTQYRKCLESDDCKSKILSSAMHFYAICFKPLNALCVAKCDSDSEEVQYGHDNLPIEKPPKTPTSSLKNLVTSSNP